MDRIYTSLDFLIGSGVQLFRGSPRGSLPNNGLAISENPGSGFRLRIYCRSDSMSENVGQFIGLNGNALTSNSFFAIARPQPGEITVENIVGSQSALPANQPAGRIHLSHTFTKWRDERDQCWSIPQWI